MRKLSNWIDGASRAAQSGATIPTLEPATGSPHGDVPDSDASDVDHTLLMRRHAEALTRIAAVESVVGLVGCGLLSESAADAAVERIVQEVDRSHG